MIRPALQLHPPRTPAVLRPAATLLWMRDTDGGPEALMTRRSPSAAFLPGVLVFPGGRIDDADAQALDIVSPRGTEDGPGTPQTAAALAALRESFEELGLLPAVHAHGAAVQAKEAAALRRDRPLYEQLRERRWLLPAHELRVLARWITDRDVAPRRFDTWFLVGRAPEGQRPEADGAEQLEPRWIGAADALARHEAGELPLIFPTLRTLRWLAGHGSVESVLAACGGGRPLWESCPRGALVGGKPQRYMEHDLPFGELELVVPDGQLLHPLDWQSEQTVPLLRHIQRLTAPNPSAMTGPGTNTYIVGSAEAGFVVIDPGPADAAHVARLLDATGGRIDVIVCTHSHPDHAPGARPLAEACAAATGHRPPIHGLASAPTARAHSEFAPDCALADGECIRIGDAEHAITLRAVHTPGHAANHLCLVLEEDELLFSGDHILNGSTTVIDPPDGDMTAYLDALDRLARECEDYRLGFILPAHGHVMSRPHLVIAPARPDHLNPTPPPMNPDSRTEPMPAHVADAFWQRWGSNTFLSAQGLELEIASTGRAIVHPRNPTLEQRGGGGSADVVNGGVIAYMFDAALGCAIASANLARPELHSIDPRELRQSTINLDISYVEAAAGPRFEAHGQVVRAGRGMAFAEGRLLDADGRVCATAKGIWRVFWPRPPAP